MIAALLMLVPSLAAPIKPITACDIERDSVTCWDSEGKLDPKIAETIDQKLRQKPAYVIMVGSKNRFLVLQSSTEQFMSITWGDDHRSGVMLGKDQDGKYLQLYQTSVPEDVSKNEITLNSREPVQTFAAVSEKTYQLAFGDTFRMDKPASVTFADVQDFCYGLPDDLAAFKWWKIAVQLPDKLGVGLPFDPQVIKFVDTQGKPLSRFPHKDELGVTTARLWSSENFKVIFTNIDPKYLTELAIWSGRERMESLGRMPFDPN